MLEKLTPRELWNMHTIFMLILDSVETVNSEVKRIFMFDNEINGFLKKIY